MGMHFEIPVVECAVPDIFVTSIVRLEFVGDTVRLVFGVEQEGATGLERMVVAKIVWSKSALPEGVRHIAAAAAMNGVLCSCMAGRQCH